MIVRASTKSIIRKKNMLIMFSAIVFFLLLLILDIISFWRLHIFNQTGFAIDIIFIAAMVNRIQSVYSCSLTDEKLSFKRKGVFFGAKQINVELNKISGIYRYKPQLIGMVHFRYSYKFHSALDGRDVWVVAYVQMNAKGKEENCRIFFKPSNEFLHDLKKQLSHKVTVSDKGVILADIKDEKSSYSHYK